MYFIWGPWEPDPQRRAGVPKVLDPGADVATLRAAVEELTYDELVSAWGSSDRRLRSETDVSRRGAVVALRGLMLDEVERRSSWRYRRWLRLGGPSRRPVQRRSAQRRSAQRRRPPGGRDAEDATPI